VELGPGGPGAAVDVWGLLRLCLTAMEPPDQPGQQVGFELLLHCTSLVGYSWDDDCLAVFKQTMATIMYIYIGTALCDMA
jgi:hypothetical protein